MKPPSNEALDGLSIPKKIAPSLSFLTTLYYRTAVFALQKIVIRPILFVQWLLAYIKPPAVRPDLVKTYGSHRHLPIRIFFPKSYDPRTPRRLPTLFTIHGGGFVVGKPDDNDHWNSKFASTQSTVVIALNYSKAPGTPFPGPIYELEALCLAVLDDPALSLHIDVSRIALLGWSAGGNLALAVSQLPSIHDHLIAVVAMYPVADFSTEDAQKANTRRYKPSLGGFRAAQTDYLRNMAPIFNWAYLPFQQDLCDPLLSPVFAARDALPRRVFVIGCEMDMLAHEAWRLVSKLAERKVPDLNEAVGREAVADKQGQLVLDDERFHWETQLGEGNEKATYRWLLVPDMIHGFDQQIGRMVKDPGLMEDAGARTKECMQLIGDWVFPSPSS
ncbi:Alpha/Beta hydrolase protein [Ilyonectria robusta]|uniref:Alpha/Beta hydrolase protein n=1 Tax=Ilyonectria robusta TaxID=1079257 RepID=UPI001E8CFFB3|nr:Alpha/Beta hydrolase protein [Ilyonectria robusta]KAH8721641.1 Alpha/Beta hydrolase protein [Ilyonectria robusta]